MKKFWRKLVVDKQPFFYHVGKQNLAVKGHGYHRLPDVVPGWSSDYYDNDPVRPSQVAEFIRQKDYFAK